MTWRNDHLEYDWFHRALPENIELGPNVYVESSYVFAAFLSKLRPGLVMREGSGVYDLTAIVAGPDARISVGAYTCLNSTTVVADAAVTIGAHCLFAWGTVITDGGVPLPRHDSQPSDAIIQMARDPLRRRRPMADPKPVIVEDNVWVGFDSVVLGGVTIGRGAIIGCKTVISENVPPYAVVVGNPPRILRFLDPDDTEESRAAALREFGLAPRLAAM